MSHCDYPTLLPSPTFVSGGDKLGLPKNGHKGEDVKNSLKWEELSKKREKPENQEEEKEKKRFAKKEKKPIHLLKKYKQYQHL